jgi:hypothetical protein
MAALPVVTSEIGDTWLHGAGSDPRKLAMTRAAHGARTACLASGACDIGEAQFRNFSRFLIKDIEHTWGRDVKTYLKDTKNWRNDQLQAQLAANASNFAVMLASWQEQRDFGLTYALGALGAAHPLRALVEEAWAAGVAPAAEPDPTTDGWAPYAPGTVYNGGRFSIAFDAATGAVSHLSDATSGQTWVDGASSLFAAPLYHTYSQDDYTAFIANYSVALPPPVSGGAEVGGA